LIKQAKQVDFWPKCNRFNKRWDKYRW